MTVAALVALTVCLWLLTPWFRDLFPPHHTPTPMPQPLTTIRIVGLDGTTWGTVTHQTPTLAWAMASDILTTHPRSSAGSAMGVAR